MVCATFQSVVTVLHSVPPMMGMPECSGHVIASMSTMRSWPGTSNVRTRREFRVTVKGEALVWFVIPPPHRVLVTLTRCLKKEESDPVRVICLGRQLLLLVLVTLTRR